MDVSSWDGTLSLNEFSLAAQAFEEKWKISNSASPPWLWVNAPIRPFVASQKVDGFLSMENICLLRPSEDNGAEVSRLEEEKTSLSEKEEAIDDATLVHSNHHEVHYYDFHIVYSASYRVPVLYFRGYDSDGLPLQLNEIEKDLPACSAKVLLESKWTFITQEEHPYFNRPWYKLHPCGTSEWMKLLFLDEAVLAESKVAIELHLVSWFSVVGQVIGLRVPIEMVNGRIN
ncbi:ubiquitin-like-conjugating enzyme ATG10 isoform X2 [Hevea brasiliensis]|nr:ubiquitin-like-conjugating enzyme ATG10 isoform X2 [Hevea brasiliensis]XP_057985132.1 ubiquitin-like-conjugating enzyme ATG10 isoform X2 [Hevea brasiliensis]